MAVEGERRHGHATEQRRTASAAGETLFAVPTHRSIGVMYLTFAAAAAVIGFFLFLAMRSELARAGLQVFADEEAFQLLAAGFGLIMVFFVIVPAMVGGFGNLFVPLLIGARETAFPRLNALAFWLFPIGFALFVVSLFSDSDGVRLPVLALLLAVGGAILGAINFVTTIFNMRAPGTPLHALPLFVWSILVSAFLLLLALPVFSGAVTLLMTGGPFRDAFLDPATHRDPDLEQHLFWFFGHPEIYMLVLPGFGMISQIVATFAKRQVIAPLLLAYAMVAIGFSGFVLWAHHLFAMGLDIDTTHYFVIATLITAAPAALMLGSWILTIWWGRRSLRAPMLWAMGFIFLFALAGVTAVVLASSGIETLPEGETYIVAHFHYVVSLSAVFGIFAGWYYWFPKITGLLYNETLAKLHFWLSFAGVNLSFFPFPVLALAGLGDGALVAGERDALALGAYCSAAGVFAFAMCMIESAIKRRIAGDNPWGRGATTREWRGAVPKVADGGLRRAA
jgi:cytochrome c oxidase subunit 1